MITITTNAPIAAEKLQELAQAINLKRDELFQVLGFELADDVKRRIASQDDGKWEQLSKWSRAQRDRPQALFGAGAYVKFKFNHDGLTVFGDTDEEWTLSQHDQGFDNNTSTDEITPDGKIEIDIVNPGPLGLSSGTRKFSWFPKKTPHTPARKIWPSEKEATAISYTTASKWLKRVVTDALEGVGAY